MAKNIYRLSNSDIEENYLKIIREILSTDEDITNCENRKKISNILYSKDCTENIILELYKASKALPRFPLTFTLIMFDHEKFPKEYLIREFKEKIRKPHLFAEELEVMTRRKDCPLEILEIALTRNVNDNIAFYAAENNNCSPELLKMVLEKGKNNDVSCNAVRNQNCPPEALKMVLERVKDDMVSFDAANNLNCPPELLKMVLERGNNDIVSDAASKNPKCPPEAIIKWCNKIGMVPKQPKIRHEDLGDLLAKNISRKIQAQTEEWYNYQTAKNTKDPEILRKILEKGNDDYWVSQQAAKNPNCHPDTLKMVLERGNDDYISYNAALNPNCHSDALTMVLKRGKNDGVSRMAAKHKNCPPDTLKMVLERGNDDGVSQNAAKNLNCPPDSLKIVLERGNDDWVSRCSAINPNCPSDVLKIVLEREKNDRVSELASKNPNCPPEAVIKWIKKIKGIIEQPKIRHEDLDDLLAENINRIIQAQNENNLKVVKEILSSSRNILIDDNLNKLFYILYAENCTEEIVMEMYKASKTLTIFPNALTISILGHEKLPKEYLLKEFKSKINNKLFFRDQLERITRRKDCPLEIIKIALIRDVDDDISFYAARNENCTPELLHMVLERNFDDDVSQEAARNKNCSPETLKMVLERGKNDGVSYYAALNDNCTREILEMVLERGNNDKVSEAACQHMNCPPEAVIKWIKKTKGIIEQPKIRHADLGDLLAENISRIIQAQIEGWYNCDTARDTKDPEILRKILEKGNDDWISEIASRNPNCHPDLLKMILERRVEDDVSCNAAYNPSCPSDALKMVLERDNDDRVSWCAASNPNCPPDALKMVLERGYEDVVSNNAASNPNCPPDTLKMVLERGEDNTVSWQAASNPNCPPEAVINWIKKTKGIIEQPKIRHEDLGDLLAKNINRKIQAQNEEDIDITKEKYWNHDCIGNGRWTLKTDKKYKIDASEGYNDYVVYYKEKQIGVEYTFENAAELVQQHQLGIKSNKVKLDVFQRIVKRLGYTEDYREAGYITPDGLLVDLSGKNEGGSPGKRALDHREMGGTIGMQKFMNKGNIRMSVASDLDSCFFNMAQEPTGQQKNIMKNIIEKVKGTIYLEMQVGLGKLEKESLGYYSRPKKYLEKDYTKSNFDLIINDIEMFYGEKYLYESPLKRFL